MQAASNDMICAPCTAAHCPLQVGPAVSFGRSLSGSTPIATHHALMPYPVFSNALET
ncbi:MAG: hypothetical protein IT497_02275 [Ottowia sp.]|nr:hypothetical protein [Ottowia sp.]